jgi:hypothetical protein
MSPRKSNAVQTSIPSSSQNNRARNNQSVPSPPRVTRSAATGLPATPPYSPTPPQYTRRGESSSVSPYSRAPPSPAPKCYHVTEIKLLTQQRKTMSERNSRLNSDNNHLRVVNKLLCSRIKVLETKSRRTKDLMKSEEDEFCNKQKCMVAFNERYQQSYKDKCKSLKDLVGDCYDLLGKMEENW